MRYLLTILLAASSTLPAYSFSLADFAAQADEYLGKYVRNGLVNYQAAKEQMTEIDQLYKAIGKADLQGASSQEKKAFYINAYNLIVIRQIAKAYPVGSPMDIQGFFDEQEHRVAGDMMTLNQLEKQRLLEPYKDARIHFVLVCAAQSCPPLASEAFKASSLEKQIAQTTQAALNDNDFIRVDSGKKKVSLSKIFDWYGSDFMAEASSLIGYVNKYRGSKIPSTYKVDFYEYDWQLNDL